ncbi:hypothetical protein [Motilimonas sp. KMU-193]|uniref:hypothetical protein n=1 Tax=Motilimonas sp. KMU-193 TaxID=3388668 RepID=UPI00396B37FD
MKHQMGKAVLRTGLQTLLITLLMFFLTNMLSPLKAATWEAELEQQALSHSGWAMAATVGASYSEEPMRQRVGVGQASMLDQVSSSIVLLLLALFSCGGIFCIVLPLKNDRNKVEHELR